MTDINIPQAVRSLLEELEACGFSAWLVGGCLRDLCRGAVPNDWDLASTATPEQLLARFPDALPTGLRFGTVTLRRQEQLFEVTTCRSDGAYSDNRRPETVRFSQSIHEDLSRRDFTVGAMAWSARDGLLDPFGGLNDLRDGRLRAVGEPLRRFEEDALRILRALRFAATLSLTPDDALSHALHAERHRLRHIARERVWAELRKLLCGVQAETVCRVYADVLAEVLGVTDAHGLGGIPPEAVPRLYHLLRKRSADDALSAVSALRTDKRTLARLATLFAWSGERDIRHLLAGAGPEGACEVLRYQGRDTAAVTRLIDEGFVWLPQQLAIGGHELRSLGYEGPDIGRTLRALLQQVQSGTLENSEEALLASIKPEP